jgi:predicted site-specific integrase-resolvase
MSTQLESPNESSYRRIECIRRGPPLLMALANGEIWTTRELADRKPPRGPKSALDMHRVYNTLDRYAQRGLIRKLRSVHELLTVREIKHVTKPQLNTREVCEIFDICRITLLEMQYAGRFPQPTNHVRNGWKLWDIADIRAALKNGGIRLTRKGRVQQWQITEEGIRVALGERKRTAKRGVA